jgi:hypothetical protein
VAGKADWPGNRPYGLPFFRDDAAEIRPGIVPMSAGGGDFRKEIRQDTRVKFYAARVPVSYPTTARRSP